MGHILRSVQKSLVRDGLMATSRRGVVFCADRLGSIRPSSRGQRREREGRERCFDEQLGVRTSALRMTARSDVIGPRWVGGHKYEALDPRFDFGAALGDLGLRYDEFVFVDVGAGMGRALFIAAQLPFKRIIGVEYSAELAGIARENIDALTSNGSSDPRLEIVHGDAVDFELPNRPLVLYLYNPFDRPVMGEFVRSVESSHAASPRRIIVVYLNPRFADLWADAGFIEHVRDWKDAAIFDTAFDPSPLVPTE
jgi:SAM-dependent methyltransferase